MVKAIAVLALLGMTALQLSSLTVQLDYYNPQFCINVHRDDNPQTKPNGELAKRTLEVNYDVSGSQAEQVKFSAWRIEIVGPHAGAKEKVADETGKADGYFEAEFHRHEVIELCWTALDSTTKDVNFLLNQVSKERVDFARMSHVDKVNERLKDLLDDFDVISHNMATRISYDTTIGQELATVKKTQTYGSAFKAALVVVACAVQTYFITCIFKTNNNFSVTQCKLICFN